MMKKIIFSIVLFLIANIANAEKLTIPKTKVALNKISKNSFFDNNYCRREFKGLKLRKLDRPCFKVMLFPADYSTGQQKSVEQFQRIIQEVTAYNYSYEEILRFLESDFNLKLTTRLKKEVNILNKPRRFSTKVEKAEVSTAISNDESQVIKKSFLIYLYRLLFLYGDSKYNIYLDSDSKYGSHDMRVLFYEDNNLKNHFSISQNFSQDSLESRMTEMARIYFSKKNYSNRVVNDVAKVVKSLQIGEDGSFSFKMGHSFAPETLFAHNLIRIGVLSPKKAFRRLFHISITPEVKGVFAPHQQKFSESELLVLLEELRVLPRKLWKYIKLNRVVRMRSMYDFPTIQHKVLGHYSESDKVIRLTDAAFESREDDWTRLGSDARVVFLHEVGHAVWAGLPQNLREAYINISWQKNPQGGYILKSGVSEPQTPYGQTSPEESFAEDFSRYIVVPRYFHKDNPNHVTSVSYQFFKYLFGVEYQEAYDENHSLYLINHDEDRENPIFIDSLEKSLDYKVLLIEEGKKAIARLNIKNLVDNKSEISQIEMVIMNIYNGYKKNIHGSFRVSEDVSGKKIYQLADEIFFSNGEDLGDMSNWQLYTLRITDKNNNTLLINNPFSITVDKDLNVLHQENSSLDKEKVLKQAREHLSLDEEYIERIKINHIIDIEKDGSIYEVVLPTEFPINFYRVHASIDLKSNTSDSVTGSDLKMSFGMTCFESEMYYCTSVTSQPGDKTISFKIFLPKEAAQQEYRISNVFLSIAKNKKEDALFDSAYCSLSNNKCPSFVHNFGSQVDYTQFIDPNKVKITEGERLRDGSKIVNLSIPAFQLIDGVKYTLDSSLYQPKGDYESLDKSNTKGGALEISSGEVVKEGELQFRLSPGYASGHYKLAGLQVEYEGSLQAKKARKHNAEAAKIIHRLNHNFRNREMIIQINVAAPENADSRKANKLNLE